MTTLPGIPNTLAVVAAASRRSFVARLVRAAGLGLLAGSVVSLAAVGAVKAWPIDLAGLSAGTMPIWGAWGLVIGLPMAVGLLVSSAWAWWTRWSARRAAVEVDTRLGLRDRLTSAMQFSDPDRNPAGFEVLTIEETERLAASPDVRTKLGSVIPLEWGRAWRWWPGAVTAGVAAAVWMPSRTFTTPEPVASTIAIADAKVQIQQAAEALREAAREDPSALRDLDAVAAIERELASGDAAAAAATTRAAEAVTQSADRLDERARAEQAAADEVRERLAAARDAITPGSPKMTTPETASDHDLIKAIQSADLETASRLAKDLAERYDQLSESDKAALSSQLSSLADRLDAANDSRNSTQTKSTSRESRESGDKSGDKASDSSTNPDRGGDDQAGNKPLVSGPGKPDQSKTDPSNSDRSNASRSGVAQPGTDHENTPQRRNEQSDSPQTGNDQPASEQPKKPDAAQNLRDALRNAANMLKPKQPEPPSPPQQPAPGEPQPNSPAGTREPDRSNAKPERQPPETPNRSTSITPETPQGVPNQSGQERPAASNPATSNPAPNQPARDSAPPSKPDSANSTQAPPPDPVRDLGGGGDRSGTKGDQRQGNNPAPTPQSRSADAKGQPAPNKPSQPSSDTAKADAKAQPDGKPQPDPSRQIDPGTPRDTQPDANRRTSPDVKPQPSPNSTSTPTQNPNLNPRDTTSQNTKPDPSASPNTTPDAKLSPESTAKPDSTRTNDPAKSPATDAKPSPNPTAKPNPSPSTPASAPTPSREPNTQADAKSKPDSATTPSADAPTGQPTPNKPTPSQPSSTPPTPSPSDPPNGQGQPQPAAREDATTPTPNPTGTPQSSSRADQRESARSESKPSDQPTDRPAPTSGTNPDGTPLKSQPSSERVTTPASEPKPTPSPAGERAPTPGTTPNPASQPQNPDAASPKGKPETKPGTDRAMPDDPRTPQGEKPTQGTKPDATTPNSPNRDDSKPKLPDTLPDQLPSAEQLKNLSKVLEDLAKQPRRAEELQKQAQSMRDRAEKMLEKATPQQREDLRKLAEQWAKQMGGDSKTPPHGSATPKPDAPGERGPREPGQVTQGDGASNPDPGRGSGGRSAPTSSGPFRDETFDLSDRSRGQGQRVLADLAPRPDAPQGDNPGPITVPPAQGRTEILRAAEAGERAVEGQAIPSRHNELVRRVFRRLSERAEKQRQPADSGGSGVNSGSSNGSSK